MVSVATFLTLLGSLLILLRIDVGRNEGYIIQYRQNLGISAFKSGSASGILSFALFMLITLVAHLALSIRVYKIHRNFSVTILGMGLLLLVTAIIVSNSLLIMR